MLSWPRLSSRSSAEKWSGKQARKQPKERCPAARIPMLARADRAQKTPAFVRRAGACHGKAARPEALQDQAWRCRTRRQGATFPNQARRRRRRCRCPNIDIQNGRRGSQFNHEKGYRPASSCHLEDRLSASGMGCDVASEQCARGRYQRRPSHGSASPGRTGR